MGSKPPADPWLDRRLIDGARQGDPAAFERLYLRYRDWVAGLALRFTGDPDDALDVLQETFAYFLRKLPDFSARAALTTFLYPVVKHLALGMRRKRRPDLMGDEGPLEVAAPDEVNHDRTRRELAEVIRALPEGQREVVLMRFVDGLSLEEIAGALTIPAGTVKSRLHHALAALREDTRTRDYFTP